MTLRDMTAVGFSAALLVLASTCLAQDPHVSNVGATQLTDGTKQVRVTYDLSNVPNGGAIVALAISTDGGATFNINATDSTLAGDFGVVAAGTGKSILWQAKDQLPSGVYANSKAQILAMPVGITSLNALTGAVNLVAGAGIAPIVPSGQSLTISSTGVTSITTPAGSGLSSSGSSGSVVLAIPAGAISNAMIADGAVGDAKIAPGVSYSKITGGPKGAYGAVVGANGGIADQNPNWLLPTNHSGEGIYSLNVRPGVFSRPPFCVCTVSGNTSNIISFGANSATLFSARTYVLASGNFFPKDDAFNIVCTSAD
ncbi:MAG: hypothetical protein ABIT01_20745 [Thermoanaerobaculia bacterium]